MTGRVSRPTSVRSLRIRFMTGEDADQQLAPTNEERDAPASGKARSSTLLNNATARWFSPAPSSERTMMSHVDGSR